MKTIRIAIIALLLTPFMGFAQEKQTPQADAKQQTEWMQKNLDLTADQLADVQEINTEYVENQAKIFASNEEKASKMENLSEKRDEYTEEIREVLNDEQFVKFQEVEKTWFEKVKGKVSDTLK